MPGNRPRGGRRQGTPGKTYANRSDMTKPQPITTAPGQGYGQAKAQEDAQRAVPMAGAPQGGSPQAPVPPTAAGLPAPGSMPGLFDDSTDPNEHVMSGANGGPGPGPEAFGYGPEVETQRDDEWIAKYLPAIEFAANLRKGDDASRQIVRLLKSRTGL